MFNTGAGVGVERTITLNVHALLLPDGSCAMVVTMFVPTGNDEPVPGVAVRLVRPHESLAPVEKLRTSGQEPTVLVTMSAGQNIAGASRSRTMTVKEQVP